MPEPIHPIPAPPLPPVPNPTPTPIPPAPPPVNWPAILTGLWAFPLVRKAAVGSGLVVLGMVLHSWFFDKPTPVEPVAIIAFERPEVHAQPGQYVTVRVKTTGRTVKWKADPRLTVNPEALADPKAKQLMGTVPGRYWVCAYTATSGWLPWHAEPSDPDHCVFVVDGPAPEPVPPTPPQPPAPIPGVGFRVLFVYPSDPNWKPTSGQLGAMYGGDVQTYLRSHCVKAPDGKTPEFRIYPDNIDLSNESQLWRDAMAKAKALFNGKFPAVLIANDTKGAAQQLPGDPAAMLKLLQSIGG